MDRTAQFYSQPTYSRGGGLPVFSGSRRQRGGSFFGAIKSIFMPIIEGIAKRGAKHGMNLATNVGKDIIQGRNFKDSLRNRAVNELQSMMTIKPSKKTKQSSKTISKPRKSVKRKIPSAKATQKAKRPRANF